VETVETAVSVVAACSVAAWKVVQSARVERAKYF
jgi:hypothetical protein